MANKLRNAADWLNRKLKQHAGESLVYSRGVHSVTLTAPLGKTLLQLQDSMGGTRMEWTDADFLITAEDLILNGSQVTPERGDRIRWTDTAGNVIVFQVQTIPSEPPWRWSDEFRITMRVHAKQIGVE